MRPAAQVLAQVGSYFKRHEARPEACPVIYCVHQAQWYVSTTDLKYTTMVIIGISPAKCGAQLQSNIIHCASILRLRDTYTYRNMQYM